MEVAMMIGIGIAILTISLFVFLLIDCLRRIEAEFPTLVYDGKTISQRVINKDMDLVSNPVVRTGPFYQPDDLGALHNRLKLSVVRCGCN